MLGLRPLSWSRPSVRWTCQSCARQQYPRISRASASYATQPLKNVAPKRRVWAGRILLGTAVAAGFFTFSETGRYVYGSIQRSGVVIRTLLICINDYRVTLNEKETQAEDEYADNLRACHKRCAERTLAGMQKNGSIFIKLGQHLSSLNYLLPSEWCDTFIPLQDHCPVTPFEDIKRMIEDDTGQTFDELFTDFEQEPLGSASLAQVHRAVDKQSGQLVAVKAQHPTLDDWGPIDLALTKFTFKTLKRAFPDYDLTWLSSEMEVSLPLELDFALEGKNALRAREYFGRMRQIPLVIPDVIWSKRRILVMEYITGHRPDDLEYLDSHRISRDEVSASLARIFNIMIFSDQAPLHCDPHGGNIAIRANPKRSSHNFDIILYDHGLYRDIPLPTRRNYAKLWLAVLDADETRMRKYAYEVAGITDAQFPLFASAITGRDYRVVTQDVAGISRSAEEKQAISEALGDGMLQQLVQLLGQVPRIILLILKTNDLTRSLDTNLHTRQGPIRSFLILAQYAARTVYEEQLEVLRATGSLLWPPRNAGRFVVAWMQYARIEMKLEVYEWYLYIRGLLGLHNPMPDVGL